jgi:hypothetical protein
MIYTLPDSISRGFKMTHVVTRLGAAFAGAALISIVSLQAAQYGGAPAAPQGRAGGAAQQNVSTPRTPDGHPDLSGMWGGGGGGGGGDKPDEKGNLTVLFKQRPCSEQQKDLGNCAQAVNFERDSGVEQRMDPIPMYKPEFWERVQYLDREGIKEDPTFHCKPAGVPRMGPPAKIVQTATELLFLYQQGNIFRVIPIDGRPHDPIKSQDTTWYGDAVGKWEGNTMVIDIVGFNDESWLGWPGWLHSNNMHVIERYTRNGNTLTWQATVEDPDVLLAPFVTEPRTLRLNPNPKATLIEDLPCEERDSQHIVTHERG